MSDNVVFVERTDGVVPGAGGVEEAVSGIEWHFGSSRGWSA